MKKLLVVLLALALIFSFAACGQQEAPAEEPAAEEAAAAEDTEICGILAKNGISQEEYSEIRGSSFVFFDDFSSMLMALDKGDITCLTTTQMVADYLTAVYPDSYRYDLFGGTSVFSMAVPAENTQLLETLNTALSALQADGTLDALKAEYIDNCDPANMPAPAQLPHFDGAQTVRIVVTGDQPPMDYMTADGQAAGFNIALLTAIANQAQINFELVSGNTASRILLITSDKADAMFWCRGYQENDGTAYNSDLPEGFSSTTPYLENPGAHLFKAL